MCFLRRKNRNMFTKRENIVLEEIEINSQNVKTIDEHFINAAIFDIDNHHVDGEIADKISHLSKDEINQIKRLIFVRSASWNLVFNLYIDGCLKYKQTRLEYLSQLGKCDSVELCLFIDYITDYKQDNNSLKTILSLLKRVTNSKTTLEYILEAMISLYDYDTFITNKILEYDNKSCIFYDDELITECANVNTIYFLRGCKHISIDGFNKCYDLKVVCFFDIKNQRLIDQDKEFVCTALGVIKKTQLYDKCRLSFSVDLAGFGVLQVMNFKTF